MNKEEARPDIHGYEERVRRYLVFIAESSIPEEDKKAIVEFSEVLRAQGLHIGRVMKYLYPPEGLRGEHHRAFTPTSSVLFLCIRWMDFRIPSCNGNSVRAS